MHVKTKKATFNLSTDVLVSLDEIMSYGIVSSKNALVEQAIVKELSDLRKQLTKAAWRAAVKDPLLLKDVKETEKVFQTADADTASR
jgi:hypothetical protein